MERKFCVICNTENSTQNFYNKYRECEQCNFKRSSKLYYENKDKLSNQRKIKYEKNRYGLLSTSKINQQYRKSHTQQIEDINIRFEELTRVMEKLLFKN